MIRKCPLFLFFILLFCSCKSENQTSANVVDQIILSFYPQNKSSVFPSDLTIYVDLAVKPEVGKIVFSVWRDGGDVPGTISIEEIDKKFRVYFTPIERAEGTYMVYFGYGSEVTFWAFFAEGEFSPLIFRPDSMPTDGEKNFPLENTMYVSFAYAVNPDVIDEETVRLIMIKPSLEEEIVPVRMSLYSNSVVVSAGAISLSTNYRIEVTNVVSLPYQNNPGTLSYKARFRSFDFSPPYIVGCSPDFCVRQCAEVDFLRGLEIRFREDEELDELSVLDNFILEKNGRRVVFSEVYKVFDTVELIKRNSISDPIKLYIYRNKIFVDFGDGISSDAIIKIYVLPRLSDSSGNLINDFFSWCVKVI